MKRKILLVAKGAGDSNAIIADAAMRAGYDLEQINNSRRAFELLKTGLPDIDLVVIDLDPGIHGISVLEALGGCDIRPPIIVVTGLEELEMTAIAYRHGASACIGKPFCATRFGTVIEKIFNSRADPRPTSCDIWGHPRGCAGTCRHRLRRNEARSLVRI